MDPNKQLDGKDTFLDVTDPQDANAEAKMSQPKIRKLWLYLVPILVLALIAAGLIAYSLMQ